VRHIAYRRLHLRLVEGIALERDYAAAAPRHHLLECGFDDGPIGIVRNEGGESALALAGGVADDAVHVGLRKKAQEIDAVGRDVGIS
jgi:hypothetical protein